MLNSNNRYIRRCFVAMAVVIVALAGGGVAAQIGPAATPEKALEKPPEKPDSTLAAESLLHSARNLLYTPNVPAKIGRLLATAKYLASLATDDVEVQKFLGNVYQIRKNFPAAAGAMRKQLNVCPSDYATWKQWQQSRLNMLNTAPERIKFLKGLAEMRLYSAAQRAEAATELARIYIGQGSEDEAKKALELAIRLNPLNSTALISRMDTTKDASAKMRTETMLALLRGNPRSSWVAKQLAAYLVDHGLHRMALRYLDYSWRVENGEKPIYDASPAFAVEYAEALLDVGQAGEVVKLFQPAVVRLGSSLDFQALMVEAYNEIGDKSNADLLRAQMARTYQSKMTSQKIAIDMKDPNADKKEITAELAADMAWFYMLLQPQPLQALRYAREAKKLSQGAEMGDVILGSAELLVGRQAGAGRLRPLTKKFPMAAYFLARQEFGLGKKQVGKKHLLEGLAVAHKALPYRLLSKLAKKYKVPVPPIKDAEIVRKIVASLDPAVLRIGLKPEDFVSVTLSPSASTVKLSEPIILRATLTNTGKVPVQIGSWGLMDNRLGLAVSLGKDESARTFASLPVVIWPAPGILEPGGSVIGQVRLDTGAVADYLAGRPLDTVLLRVQGLVSPRDAGRRILSELPSVNPKLLIIRRIGIIGSDVGSFSDRYNKALGAIVDMQARGTVDQRLTAARQVASLLKWYRNVEEQKTLLPGSMKAVVRKEILLGMLARSLRDKTTVVRSEILSALVSTDIDGAILNQIGLVIDDPSPLVRFRVAELLGASGNKGNLRMLEMFTKDKNKFVRMMAVAFLRAGEKKNEAKNSN